MTSPYPLDLGTFRPIETERVEDHPMHAEEYFLSPSTKSVLRDPSLKRLAIGTTCVRAIEHYLRQMIHAPKERPKRKPNYLSAHHIDFLGIDHLLTNFHLPGSTLLCLVAAFLTPSQPDGLVNSRNSIQMPSQNNTASFPTEMPCSFYNRQFFLKTQNSHYWIL